MSELLIEPSPDPIHRVAAGLAVVGLFSDERPLRGAAGLADWRLCGALSQLIRAERFAGASGEAALIPSRGGLRAPLVLAFGLGPRVSLDGVRRGERFEDALARALALRVGSLAIALPPAVPEDAAGLDARIEALLGAASRAQRAAGPGRGPSKLLLVAPSELRPGLYEGLRRRAAEATAPAGTAIEMPVSELLRRPPAGAAGAARPPELRVK